jgi:hypothetical protein
MRKAFPCLLIALALAVPAFAQDDPEEVEQVSTEARVPNFLSTSGLLFTPSAYVPRNGDISVHFAGHENFLAGGGTVGIADRFELGLGWADFDDDDDGHSKKKGDGGRGSGFLLNAKFNLLREELDKWYPSVSIGVIDALDEFDIDQSWYVVLSKYLTRRSTDASFALKGHLGYGDGVFDDGVFAGLELFFSRNLEFMAEYIDDEINLGGRYIYRGFAFTLGLFDFDQFGGGISYTFRFGGGGGEATTTAKNKSNVTTAAAVK